MYGCVGKILNPDTVSQSFKLIVSQNGLHPIRFHDLRHSYIPILAALTDNPKMVQDSARHANISTKFNVYAHTKNKVPSRVFRKLVFSCLVDKQLTGDKI